jgi:hypothetical protein
MKNKNLLVIVCSLAVISLTSEIQADGRGGGRPQRGARQHQDNDRDRLRDLGTKDPRINQRQENQTDRVKQGVRSGQLTKEEVKDLGEERRDIRKEEQEYKSDGEFTKEERKDIHQDLNAASKDIYQEKHDDETRELTPDPMKLGTKDPGVNARQENQKDRIAQGVKSGELTKREAHTLAEKEAKLAFMERRFKQSGDSLNAEERARIQQRLSMLSAEIAKEKHDGQDR